VSYSLPDAVLLEGLADLHQGRFAQAQRKFRSYLEGHPTDPRGHLFLAFCEWWKQLQVGGEARTHAMEYHLDEAIRLAQDQLNRSPGDPQVLTSLGTAHIFMAQYRASEKKVFKAASSAKKGKAFLEKAVQANPDLVDAQFGLGAYNYYADKVSLLVKGLRSLLFLPGGDSDKGIAQLQDVAQRGRYFRTEAHLLLAVIYQSRNEQRYRLALDHLEAALDLNAESPLIQGSIGELQLRLANYPESHAVFQNAIARCATSADRDQEVLGHLLQVLLADSLDLSLNSGTALNELRTSMKDYSFQADWRSRALGVATRAAFRLGDTESLEQIYRSLSATQEERSALRTRYGNPAWNDPALARSLTPILSKMESGPSTSALPLITALLEEYPRAPELLFHRGRLSFQDGQWEEAQSWLARIPESPSTTAPWVLGWKALFLGRSRWEQGSREGALTSYRLALEVDGFRGKDLARELLGPEGSGPQVWPKEIFALGLQASENSRHVAAGLSVGGDAAVTIHDVLAGVVGSEGQGGVVVPLQKELQVPHAPF
jgi:tetratricopeptide (TPR) repeat protein